MLQVLNPRISHSPSTAYLHSVSVEAVAPRGSGWFLDATLCYSLQPMPHSLGKMRTNKRLTYSTS